MLNEETELVGKNVDDTNNSDDVIFNNESRSIYDELLSQELEVGSIRTSDIDKDNNFSGFKAVEPGNTISEIENNLLTSDKHERKNISDSGNKDILNKADISAKAVSSSVCIILPRIASLISGMESERYKISNNDKRDYEIALRNYFEVTEMNVSPLANLILCSVAIMGGTIMQALSDKKEVKKIRAERIANEKYRSAILERKISEVSTSPSIKNEIINDKRKVENDARTDSKIGERMKIFTDELNRKQERHYEVKRKRYNIDENGFYVWSEENEYIRKKERSEKPKEDILYLIKSGMKSREIKRELETN